MNKDPSAFIDLLGTQLEIHRTLLELSYEKRQVIIKNDIERLDEIVQRELKCLARLNQAEKRRAKAVSEYAGLLGISEDKVNLGLIIEGAGREQAEKLEELRKGLNAVLGELNDINKLNQELIGSQLEYTETMINVFAGPDDPLNNYYGGDGRADDDIHSTPGFYDTSV